MLRFTLVLIGVLAGAYGCGGKAAGEPKSAAAGEPKTAAASVPKTATGEIVMSVTDKGFEPDQLTVKRGEPVKLLITRKTDQTCAKEIVVDEYAVRAELPLNVPVHVAFTPTKSGTLRYGCAMEKMIGGVLTVQ